jgi:hypothetical protein
MVAAQIIFWNIKTGFKKKQVLGIWLFAVALQKLRKFISQEKIPSL